MSTFSKIATAVVAALAITFAAGCSEQKKEEKKTESNAPKQQGMDGMTGQQGMGGMSGQQGMGGMSGQPAPKP